MSQVTAFQAALDYAHEVAEEQDDLAYIFTRKEGGYSVGETTTSATGELICSVNPTGKICWSCVK